MITRRKALVASSQALMMPLTALAQSDEKLTLVNAHYTS
jgi:hypothetical protein